MVNTFDQVRHRISYNVHPILGNHELDLILWLHFCNGLTSLSPISFSTHTFGTSISRIASLHTPFRATGWMGDVLTILFQVSVLIEFWLMFSNTSIYRISCYWLSLRRFDKSVSSPYQPFSFSFLNLDFSSTPSYWPPAHLSTQTSCSFSR